MASWLVTIDRTGIASHVFNADHPKIAADGRLPNLDHSEDKQIVERVGLSDRRRRDPIELWDSGADQFGDMRRLGGSAAPMLKE